MFRRFGHLAQARQGLANRQVPRHSHKLSCHESAGGVIGVRQQFGHVELLVILHAVEQIFCLGFRQIASTSAASSGDMCSRMSAARSSSMSADNLSLTFGGHFFKRFGGRFIVERFHNIGAVLVGESLSQARDFDRMQASQFSSGRL